MFRPVGSRNGKAKLTEAAIVSIRSLWASGERQRTLAENHNVSQSTICEITRGNYWRHVPDWKPRPKYFRLKKARVYMQACTDKQAQVIWDLLLGRDRKGKLTVADVLRGNALYNGIDTLHVGDVAEAFRSFGGIYDREILELAE